MRKSDWVLVICLVLLCSGVGFQEWRVGRSLDVVAEKVASIEHGIAESSKLRDEQARQLYDRIYDIVASDKNIALAMIDADLYHLENAQYGLVVGSYSDWVLPTLHGARVAGASMEEVDRRLNRILELAKQGKYFSSSLESAAKAGKLEEEIRGSREWLARIGQKG
jgi:hypothetical protein